MTTTITKTYNLYTPSKELIKGFQSMEELIIYVREELDGYSDYPIEEEVTIRNFY